PGAGGHLGDLRQPAEVEVVDDPVEVAFEIAAQVLGYRAWITPPAGETIFTSHRRQVWQLCSQGCRLQPRLTWRCRSTRVQTSASWSGESDRRYANLISTVRMMSDAAASLIPARLTISARNPPKPSLLFIGSSASIWSSAVWPMRLRCRGVARKSWAG